MQQYKICGLTIRVSGKGLNNISGFSVFLSEYEYGEHQDALIINLGETLSNWNLAPLYSFQFEEVPCEFASANGRYFFRMRQANDNHLLMEIHKQGKGISVTTNMDECTPSHWLRFAVWLAFGIYSVFMQTVAIHASTVTYKGKSILFLGESGKIGRASCRERV